MSVLTVLVDHSKCSGLGLCEAAAPDVFEVGADGNLTVHYDQIDEAKRAELEQAVEACPTQALSISES